MSRRYRSQRRISLSDTDTSGRLRLDAIARYLQDIASEDWLDAGFDHDSHVWVVRRTELTVESAFLPEDELEVETWCSGVAPSAASRRYSVRGARGGRVEAESIWIHLGHDLRPKRLDARFVDVYGSSAAGRRASTRLGLPVEPTGTSKPWSFRSTDVDRLGHVNNAAYWVPVEEAWHARLEGRIAVVLEYRRPIDLDETIELAVDGYHLWLTVAGEARAVANLQRS